MHTRRTRAHDSPLAALLCAYRPFFRNQLLMLKYDKDRDGSFSVEEASHDERVRVPASAPRRGAPLCGPDARRHRERAFNPGGFSRALYLQVRRIVEDMERKERKIKNMWRVFALFAGLYLVSLGAVLGLTFVANGACQIIRTHVLDTYQSEKIPPQSGAFV